MSSVFKSISAQWLKDLYIDEDYWAEEAFEKLPAPIASDYKRLLEMIQSGNPYGGLLLLKDNFEVGIKYAASVYLAKAFELGLHHKDFAEVFSFLVEKALSLGGWLGILVEFQNNKLQVLKKHILSDPVLKALKDVPRWRNDQIGHGGLAWEDNPEFQEEFKAKLKLLKEMMSDLLDWHKGLRLVCEPLDIEFTGVAAIRRHHDINAENHLEQLLPLTLVDSVEGDKTGLMPFIRLQKCRICHYRDIFFLDSIVHSKSRLYLVDFYNGHKMALDYSEDQHAARLKPSLKASLSPEANKFSASSDYLPYSLHELIEGLDLDRFHVPVHIRDWLKNGMEHHGKGVFLLRMGRGMGKSVFVRALKENRGGKLRHRDYHVVSFHINSLYHYSANAFRESLNWFINVDDNGKPLVNPGTTPFPSLQVSLNEDQAPKDFFAQWLNEWVALLQNVKGKEGVIVCIDGLDELPESESKEPLNILDFIPDPDSLQHGAFVLLTCRLEDETPAWINRPFHASTSLETLCVVPEDEQNIRLLEGYIKSNIKAPPDLVQMLLQQAQNRFLYVGHMVGLLQKDPSIRERLAEIGSGPDLFKNFLKELEYLYPANIFERLKTLLLVLALAPSPVTKEELLFLISETELDFVYMAILKDLTPILKQENSSRGRAIALAHEEIVQFVKAAWKNEASQMASKILDEFLNHSDLNTPGILYVAENLEDYVRDKSLVKIEELTRLLIKEKEVANLLRTDSGMTLLSEYQIRLIRIETQIINLSIALRSRLKPLGNWAPKFQNDLAAAFVNRGNAYSDLGKHEDAVRDYGRAIEMMEALRKTLETQGNWAPGYQNDLAAAFMNRGNAYQALGKHEDAVRDYGRAIEIREALRKTLETQGNWAPGYQNDLATAFMNKALLYLKMGMIEDWFNLLLGANQKVENIQLKSMFDDSKLILFGLLPPIYIARHHATDFHKIETYIQDFYQEICPLKDIKVLIERGHDFYLDAWRVAQHDHLRELLLSIYGAKSFEKVLDLINEVSILDESKQYERFWDYLKDIFKVLFNIPDPYHAAIRTWIEDKCA